METKIQRYRETGRQIEVRVTQREERERDGKW